MTAFHIGYGDLSHTVFRSFRVETESSNLLFVAEGFDAQKWGVFFKPTSGGSHRTGPQGRQFEVVSSNSSRILLQMGSTCSKGGVQLCGMGSRIYGLIEWLGPMDAMRRSTLWLFDGYLRGKSMISHEIRGYFIHFHPFSTIAL